MESLHECATNFPDAETGLVSISVDGSPIQYSYIVLDGSDLYYKDLTETYNYFKLREKLNIKNWHIYINRRNPHLPNEIKLSNSITSVLIRF